LSRYVLTILSVIILIGTVTLITFKFDISFAFHTPGSGFTIIGGQVYANNGTDTDALAPLFVRPQNDTLNFANPSPAVPQQPMNGSANFANLSPAVPQQPMNGTQNQNISSPSDIVSHLNLARQGVELGDPNTILQSLDFIQQQLSFLATQNSTTNFSNMSNYYGSTGLQAESTQNMTKNQPEDPEDFVPVEEQRPTSSASHRDPTGRTRTIQ
jgi:hypothetical protein